MDYNFDDRLIYTKEERDYFIDKFDNLTDFEKRCIFCIFMGYINDVKVLELTFDLIDMNKRNINMLK